MTRIDELQQCECEKLDPLFVDAFIKHYLDPADETRLILDSSWGESEVDLTPAVKAAETITHLFLTPEENPRALQFNREDYMREGAENDGIDCIEGDALSRIISMRYLKDVDQGTTPRGGDVYMFNEVNNLFYTFNLQGYMDKTDKRLGDLEGKVNNLQQAVNNLTTLVNNINQRLQTVELTVAKPIWAPDDSRLAWGTTNSMWAENPSQFGIYSHDPDANVTGDCQFR